MGVAIAIVAVIWQGSIPLLKDFSLAGLLGFIALLAISAYLYRQTMAITK